MIIFWINSFIQKPDKTCFFFEPGNYFFFSSFKSLRLHGLDFIPSSDCSEARRDHNLAKYIHVPKIKQLLQTSELPHWCCWKGIFLSQRQTSCWAVGRGRELRGRPCWSLFHPHCLFIHPLPPQIGWACHLRLSHIDKFKVHSGTRARKDNKTFILLIKIFSQTWGYSLAHSRHPIKFTEEKDTERERRRKRREGGREGRKAKKESKERDKRERGKERRERKEEGGNSLKWFE